jgi:hypothetical protein
MWIFQLLILKNVSDGPASANLASLAAVLPAFLSPFGGSAETVETKRKVPVSAHVSDFLKFIIKFSTSLILV